MCHFRDIINENPERKSRFLYFYFTIDTNKRVRAPIDKKFRDAGYDKTAFAQYDEYFRTLAGHKFVVSPPGKRLVSHSIT